MILLYHKVYLESPTEWWVDSNDFWRQMYELQNYEVVNLADYDPNNPEHVVITFDGVYENVFQFALPVQLLSDCNLVYRLVALGK